VRQKTPLTFNHELTFSNPRNKRYGWWVLLVLLSPLIGGTLAHSLSRPATPPAASATAADTPQDLAQESAAEAAPEEIELPPTGRVEVVIQPNDTLERIFRELKLSTNDLKAVLNVPGVRRTFELLRPGDKITIVHQDGVLHGLSRRLNDTQVLSVTRKEDGFAAEVLTLPVVKIPETPIVPAS